MAKSLWERGGAIGAALRDLRAPLDVPPLYIPFMSQAPPSKSISQNNAVIQALEIQSLLREPTPSGIYAGDVRLSSLTIALNVLQMYEEAVTVSTWKVNLWRILAAIDPSGFPPFTFPILFELFRCLTCRPAIWTVAPMSPGLKFHLRLAESLRWQAHVMSLTGKYDTVKGSHQYS
ncbi:hypothetical protein BDZ97DRAFT_1918009 [Flammula alnicola]|nr:hypothetical protein BDZ97DRAFT_1918009 [Flammula alnicola]